MSHSDIKANRSARNFASPPLPSSLGSSSPTRRAGDHARSRKLCAQRGSAPRKPSPAYWLSALISQLQELDEEIRSHAVPTKSSPAAAPQKGSYASLELAKAGRLVAACEKRLELLRKKQREEEEKLWRQVEEGQEAADLEEGQPEGEKGDEARHATGGDARGTLRSREVMSKLNASAEAVD